MTGPPRSSNRRFLPADSLSAAQLLRVDSICQRFEVEWKAGRMPSLEAYLNEAAEGERDTLAAVA